MPQQKITSSKCNECERIIVPPRETCPYCGLSAGPMREVKLEPQGTVQSYTTLQTPPEGFEPPLRMALVELEQGALILCLAAEKTDSPINIGDRVEIEVDSESRFRYRVFA